MSRNPSYETGYGKPPKDTQFKPGQSGNPKGRPRGSKNFATIVQEAASERVMVTEHGRQRWMTKLEVCVSQVMNRAAKGELPAMKIALGLIRESEAALEAEQPEQAAEHTQAMNDLLAQRLRMMQKAAGAGGA